MKELLTLVFGAILVALAIVMIQGPFWLARHKHPSEEVRTHLRLNSGFREWCRARETASRWFTQAGWRTSHITKLLTFLVPVMAIILVVILVCMYWESIVSANL